MTAISAAEIQLNERELKARLGGMPAAQAQTLVDACRTAVFREIRAKYTYRETTVRLTSTGCVLDFGFIESQNLRRALRGCSRAYVFAATLGHDVDRLLQSAGLISPLRQFVTDAVASTAIEALCDLAQARLPRPTKARFSAGYGDFSLDYQQQLLDFLNAQKTIGLSLSASCLMNPTKSVTAIMGIKK